MSGDPDLQADEIEVHLSHDDGATIVTIRGGDDAWRRRVAESIGGDHVAREALARIAWLSEYDTKSAVEIARAALREIGGGE